MSHHWKFLKRILKPTILKRHSIRVFIQYIFIFSIKLSYILTDSYKLYSYNLILVQIFIMWLFYTQCWSFPNMAHYDCMICKYIDAFNELSCGIQRFSAAEGLQLDKKLCSVYARAFGGCWTLCFSDDTFCMW